MRVPALRIGCCGRRLHPLRVVSVEFAQVLPRPAAVAALERAHSQRQPSAAVCAGGGGDLMPAGVMERRFGGLEHVPVRPRLRHQQRVQAVRQREGVCGFAAALFGHTSVCVQKRNSERCCGRRVDPGGRPEAHASFWWACALVWRFGRQLLCAAPGVCRSLGRICRSCAAFSLPLRVSNDAAFAFAFAPAPLPRCARVCVRSREAIVGGCGAGPSAVVGVAEEFGVAVVVRVAAFALAVAVVVRAIPFRGGRSGDGLFRVQHFRRFDVDGEPFHGARAVRGVAAVLAVHDAHRGARDGARGGACSALLHHENKQLLLQLLLLLLLPLLL